LILEKVKLKAKASVAVLRLSLLLRTWEVPGSSQYRRQVQASLAADFEKDFLFRL